MARADLVRHQLFLPRTLSESLALFVRYMLTVNAPLAKSGEASRAIGRDRFAAFVKRVGQQLASGRSSLAPGQGQ